MRHPFLLAAAVAVTGGSLGVFAYSERRQQPETVQQHLRTMDAAALPSQPTLEIASGPASPPPAPRQVALPKMDSEPPAEPTHLLPETAPRIAYSYGYRFRVPAAALAALQERHLRLCLDLGAARCRIVSMRRSEPRPEEQPRPPSDEAGQPAAALEVQVAAALADEFGRRLTASSGEAGGKTVDRQIGAEDVSREMVDSEARIRTRETLIRRLSALLETRSGNIEQAVDAERAINQAQEELDAAQTWLADMRGRVAMSRIAIQYEAAGTAAAPRERNPIAASWSQIGALMTQSLAALLLVAGVVLPWLGIGLLVLFAARWHRRRTQLSDSAAI